MSEIEVEFTEWCDVDNKSRIYKIIISNDNVKFQKGRDYWLEFPKEVIIDFMKDKEEFIKALAMLGYYGD